MANFRSVFSIACLLFLAACSSSEADGKDKQSPPAPLPLSLADRPDASASEKLYIAKCATCHSDAGMGTGLLQRRSQTPLLESRTDLQAAFVVGVVRNGMGNMPPLTRTEVTDAELREIAAYLSARPAGSKK